MNVSSIQRLTALLMTICLITLPIAQTANAAIIGTTTAIEMAEREQQIDRINSMLARDSVQSAMVKLGVDPADASARVNSLTNDELLTLEENLAELPAGGAGFFEVIGIVAVVLVFLELLNVTNFFSEF